MTSENFPATFFIKGRSRFSQHNQLFGYTNLLASVEFDPLKLKFISDSSEHFFSKCQWLGQKFLLGAKTFIKICIEIYLDKKKVFQKAANLHPQIHFAIENYFCFPAIIKNFFDVSPSWIMHDGTTESYLSLLSLRNSHRLCTWN